MIKSSQSVDKFEKIIIGKIGAAHGVQGEVRVTPLTDFPDRFDDLKSVYIADKNSDGKRYEIKSKRDTGKFLILKFVGIDDRDVAKTLTGKFLKVDRSEVPPVEDGEFYVFDLIGLPVFDENRNELGKVEAVIKGKSNDNLSIRSKDGREILIPLLKESIKSIDLEQGEICVSMS